MKKSVAITVIAILAIAAIALGVLYYTNNDSKTKDIAARDADIADKAGQIETLSADVAEKAGQIETLNADVVEKAGQIETLNADVADKAGQIETLNANVAEKTSQIETLNADVTDKAGQIEALNADVTDKAGQIEALNADVADKAGQIEALNADLADKVGQIETLNADVADKAGQIETLNADVADKAGQIETLNADVAEKAGQIETLNADIADKSGQIEKLNADVAEKAGLIETLNANVEKLTSDLTEKDGQIDALNSDVADKGDQIDALKADVADKTSQIEALTAEVADKAGQVESLNVEIGKKDSQISMLQEMVSGNTTSASDAIESDNPLVNAPTEEFVIDRLSRVPDIAYIAAATEDNDPNGGLSKQGGYTAQVYFTSPLVNPSYANKPDMDIIKAGTSAGGSVEVYRTVADAIKREKYLAGLDGTIMASGSHKVVGTVLVRTSNNLKASDQQKLEAEIIEALTSENPGPVIDKGIQAPVEMVTVKECGFSVSSGYYYYSFIAHCNLTDKAIQYPEFRIVLRDKDGGLISTTTQTLSVLYPGQDVVYAFLGGQIDETPATIEVSFSEPEDDWHIVDPSKLDHSQYKPLEVQGAKQKDGKVIGELYNPNDFSMSTVAVTVVFRDASGNLLGGETTFENNIKAGATIPFELRVSSSVATTNFEVYAQPW